jgi:hypothetical protein
MTSGVLPKTVYPAGRTIFDWAEDGGALYWIGYAIGALVADGKVLSDVPNYQADIFGVSGCILTEETRSSERTSDLGRALALTQNNVTFGIDTNTVPDSLSLGYEYDGYSSISLVKKGNGMICVIGGKLDGNARTSVSQIIASGVSWSSELLETVKGSLVRNSSSDQIGPWAGAKDIGVHVRIGEPYTVFARTFFF